MPHCAERRRNRCAARKLIGAHFPGGYAEYAVVPAANAVPLPLRMTARTGALTGTRVRWFPHRRTLR